MFVAIFRGGGLVFYLEVSVGATVSLGSDCFSILIRVWKFIYFSIFFVSVYLDYCRIQNLWSSVDKLKDESTSDYYHTQYVRIYRKEEYNTYSYSMLRSSAPRIILAAYLSPSELLTLRAAHRGEFNQGIFVELLILRFTHIGELNQRLSSIRTFVRPNKLNVSRR